MKHIFIMNPVAGTRLARRMKRQIAKTCRRLRVDYYTHYTRSADDAPQYVRKLLDTHPEETYRIYAVGGDGTVSDLSGVVYGRENAELAVIPIGTGNDFTRNFGSPKEFCDIEDYINGSAIEVDAIRYNDSVSINVTNMGFDCEVVDMMERNRSKPLMNNSFSYTICVFMVLARMPKGHVRFVMEDGSVRESRFLLSLFGNGAYYGGGYKAASKADLQDGLLEWIEVPDSVTRRQFLGLVGMYKKGTLLDNRAKCEKIGIRYRRVRKITLEAMEPMKICVDGEIKDLTTWTVECLPRAIRFALPKTLYDRFPGDKTLRAAQPEERSVGT